jgi:hypothetical protein
MKDEKMVFESENVEPALSTGTGCVMLLYCELNFKGKTS